MNFFQSRRLKTSQSLNLTYKVKNQRITFVLLSNTVYFSVFSVSIKLDAITNELLANVIVLCFFDESFNDVLYYFDS